MAKVELNSCCFWHGGDTKALARPVTPSTAPDEGMLVIVPVRGGPFDSLLDLGPGLEAASLQGQGAQHLPPRLDQVQVGGVLGLEDELPARMQQAEQQHVGGAVDVEVVEHRVDPLDRGIDPGLDLAQEVDPVDGGAALVGQGEGGTGRGLEGAEHVAGDATPAVVDLLPGALRLGPGRLDEPPARVALGRLRPHLVQADYDAAGRCRGVELLYSPLLRAKSGSTRSPNQVSSRRHLRPSRTRISPIRLRRMAMPRSVRWATRRSRVQDANGRPRSAGRVSAASMTVLLCSAEYVGGRPVRTSSSNLWSPRALKRLSQCRTVAPHRSIRAPISGALRPSSACRTIRARRTRPAPRVRDRAIRSSPSRSSSLKVRTRRVMAGLRLRSPWPPDRPLRSKSQSTCRMHH